MRFVLRDGACMTADQVFRLQPWQRMLGALFVCTQVVGCGELTVKPPVVAPLIGLDCQAPIKWFSVVPSGRLVVYTLGRRILVWDLSNAKAPAAEYLTHKGVWDWDVAFPSETLAAWGLWEISNAGKQAVVIYDLGSRSEKHHFDLPQDSDIGCIAVSRSGKLVVWTEAAMWGGRQCTLRVLDLSSRTVVSQVAIPVTVEHQRMDHLAISLDETTVAAGSSSGEGSIAAVDVKTSKLLWKVFRLGGMDGIAFHPDSRSFFVSGYGKVERHDVATGRRLSVWDLGEGVGGIDVSSGGDLVAVAAFQSASVVILDSSSGKKLETLHVRPQANMRQLRFSSDGRGIWMGDAVIRNHLELLPLRQASELQKGGGTGQK